MCQTKKLLAALRGGQWKSNFWLYKCLYGNGRCGRLGARVYDLKHMGHIIDARTDAEHVEARGLRRKPLHQRYWYRLWED